MMKGKRALAQVVDETETIINDTDRDEILNSAVHEEADWRPVTLRAGETLLDVNTEGNQFLPGTEPVVDQQLVDIITELKEAENARLTAQREETRLRAAALERMKAIGITEYRVAGFEATINVNEKVKVRIPKTDDEEF